MVSALFLIAGIHSTTNLKTYEQANNFFNPADTDSPHLKNSLKDHTFIGMCSLLTWFNIKKNSIYVINDIDTLPTLSDV